MLQSPGLHTGAHRSHYVVFLHNILCCLVLPLCAADPWGDVKLLFWHRRPGGAFPDKEDHWESPDDGSRICCEHGGFNASCWGEACGDGKCSDGGRAKRLVQAVNEMLGLEVDAAPRLMLATTSTATQVAGRGCCLGTDGCCMRRPASLRSARSARRASRPRPPAATPSGRAGRVRRRPRLSLLRPLVFDNTGGDHADRVFLRCVPNHCFFKQEDWHETRPRLEVQSARGPVPSTREKLALADALRLLRLEPLAREAGLLFVRTVNGAG